MHPYERTMNVGTHARANARTSDLMHACAQSRTRAPNTPAARVCWLSWSSGASPCELRPYPYFFFCNFLQVQILSLLYVFLNIFSRILLCFLPMIAIKYFLAHPHVLKRVQQVSGLDDQVRGRYRAHLERECQKGGRGACAAGRGIDRTSGAFT